jgi:hypothetical protein
VLTGANGGICSADMLELEDIEMFVEVRGLAGQKINH